MIGVSVLCGIRHRTASASWHIADDMLAALKVRGNLPRRASGVGAMLPIRCALDSPRFVLAPSFAQLRGLIRRAR